MLSLDAAIQRIRATDMQDVCAALGMDVRKSGSGRVALCQWHEERSASMQVYADHVHCWVCQGHGDAIALAARVWGLSNEADFVEAASRLSEALGIGRPVRNPREQERARAVRAAENAAEIVYKAAYEALWGADAGERAADALKWLRDVRGIGATAAKAAGLGLLSEWGAGVVALRATGEDALESGIAAGLVVRRKSSKGFYDALHHSLIFPLRRAGRVVSLRGRPLPIWIENEGAPKSRAPRRVDGQGGTAAGGALVDLPRIWAPMPAVYSEAGAVLNVEGEMDALALAEVGLPSVATLGAGAVGPEVGAELRKLRAARVVVWADGDRAGAAMAAAVARELGERCYVPGWGAAGLAEGDGDVLVPKDANAALLAWGSELLEVRLLRAIEAAVPWWEAECERLRVMGAGGRQALRQAREQFAGVVGWLAAPQNDDGRANLCRDVAKAVGVDVCAGLTELRKAVAKAVRERCEVGTADANTVRTDGDDGGEGGGIEGGGDGELLHWHRLLAVSDVQSARAARAESGGASEPGEDDGGRWGGLDPLRWVPIPAGGEHTEVADGRRVALLHGDGLRYVEGAESWAVYDGARWVQGAQSAAEGLAEDVAAIHAREVERLEFLAAGAGEKGPAAWVRAGLVQSRGARDRCLSARGRRGVLDAARTVPGIVVHVRSFDPDPFLLVCPNGAVDLRTGKVRGHRRADMASKMAGVQYDPGAPRDAWEHFLTGVASGSADPAAWLKFVKRWAGYCLTGDISEQVLVFGVGTGSNGKGTLWNSLAMALGDYAQTGAPGLLEAQEGGERHPVELADLAGARAVFIHETEAARRVAESRVKSLTGGDKVRARQLHKAFFEFKPQAKFTVVGNTRPKIRGTDDGIWRRIILLRFGASFANRGDQNWSPRSLPKDSRLGEAIEAQIGGVLAWAVEGAQEWAQEGLAIPSECKVAGAEFRADSDPLGAFFEEHCIEDSSARVSVSDLHRGFCEFLKDRKEAEWTLTLFGKRLGDRGMERVKSDGIKVVVGYRLRSEPAYGTGRGSGLLGGGSEQPSWGWGAGGRDGGGGFGPDELD